MARLIVYKTSEFYFLEGKLSGFRLQDSKFSIGNGKSFVKIGDHYSLVEKIFPSYKNEIDSHGVETSRRIFITLSNGEFVVDDALIILFDSATGKISEILI
jgi:hypothetical protein